MYIIKIYELYIINCVAHLKIAINARIMTSVHRISNSRFIFAKKNSKKKEKKGKFIWKRRKKKILPRSLLEVKLLDTINVRCFHFGEFTNRPR